MSAHHDENIAITLIGSCFVMLGVIMCYYTSITPNTNISVRASNGEELNESKENENP